MDKELNLIIKERIKRITKRDRRRRKTREAVEGDIWVLQQRQQLG